MNVDAKYNEIKVNNTALILKAIKQFRPSTDLNEYIKHTISTLEELIHIRYKEQDNQFTESIIKLVRKFTDISVSRLVYRYLFYRKHMDVSPDEIKQLEIEDQNRCIERNKPFEIDAADPNIGPHLKNCGINTTLNKVQ